MAAVGNDYMLGFESLFRRTFTGLNHEAARRKLQDLRKALQGNFGGSRWWDLLWIHNGFAPGYAWSFKHVVDDIVKPSGASLAAVIACAKMSTLTKCSRLCGLWKLSRCGFCRLAS